MKAWKDALFNRKMKQWGWGETVWFCFSEILRKELINYQGYNEAKRLKNFEFVKMAFHILNLMELSFQM